MLSSAEFFLLNQDPAVWPLWELSQDGRAYLSICNCWSCPFYTLETWLQTLAVVNANFPALPSFLRSPPHYKFTDSLSLRHRVIMRNKAESRAKKRAIFHAACLPSSANGLPVTLKKVVSDRNCFAIFGIICLNHCFLGKWEVSAQHLCWTMGNSIVFGEMRTRIPNRFCWIICHNRTKLMFPFTCSWLFLSLFPRKFHWTSGHSEQQLPLSPTLGVIQEQLGRKPLWTKAKDSSPFGINAGQ